jgi:predicted DNA-binding protein (UPF0251 family)
MSLLGSTTEWREEALALERFALALAPDVRLPRDPAAVAFLVESLMNRALLAAHNGEGPRGLNRRSRLLSLFVRFHRRHVRLQGLDDEAVESAGRDGVLVERAVAALPLELREALLLVVLERLSHVEAAEVLEVPYAALIERLTRARVALSRSLAPPAKSAARPRGGPPHLRLIK